MKVTCDREQLLPAFQTAAAVAPGRSPKPILQNVKLEVVGDSAILHGHRPGSRHSHQRAGRRSASAGQRRPAGRPLRLDPARKHRRAYCTSKPTARARSSAASAASSSLPAENPQEFPAVADFNEQKYHELPARLLRELIRRTIFATDNESSRYALGGVMLELAADKITAVGTDGRRLAKMEGPARASAAISRRRQHDHRPHPGDAAHRTGPRRRRHRSANRRPRQRHPGSQPAGHDLLAAGRRPLSRVARRVPAARRHGRRSNWPSARCYAAVRQAAIVTSEESRGIDFTFGDGSLVLAGHAAEVGQSRVELPIAYDGPAIVDHARPALRDRLPKVLDPEKTFTLD